MEEQTKPNAARTNLASDHSPAHKKLRHAFRRWLVRMIALALGLIVAVIFGEVALRIIGISYPLPYQTDPYCGTRLQPSFSAHFNKEGRGQIKTTSDGRRDREYTQAKPQNVFRIAVLGDSYAEALQVAQEETFWSIMNVELAKCDKLRGKDIEVLNFGVSGFGTAQELQMLEYYVWDYQPDLVLVAFLSGNDISDNSKELSSYTVRPFFRIENNLLVLDDSFLSHPTYLAANSSWGRTKTWWINHSRILQLLRETFTQVRNKPKNAETTMEIEVGLDSIYSPPVSKEWSNAWDVTERLLQRMSELCQEHACQFCVVTLSNAIQVDPDPLKRAILQKKANLEHWFYPDFRVAELGKRQHFSVLNLAPAMQAEAERTQTFFHGFANTQYGTGHWNRDGHRFAGEWIASELCPLLDGNIPSAASAPEQVP